MARRRAVAEFAWASLARVERAPEAAVRAYRRALAGRSVERDLESALGALLEAEIAVRVRRGTARAAPTGFVRVGLSAYSRRPPSADRSTGARGFVVAAEPALVTALLSRLLRRPVPLLHPEASLEPALHGAFSALVLEAARAAGGSALRLASTATEGALYVELDVRFEGRGYAASLALPAVGTSSFAAAALRADRSTPDLDAVAALGRLRQAEIELPLVVALSASTPRELGGLELGGAFVPGGGFWVDRTLSGRGVLVSPLGERGLGVELSGPGRIVLRGPMLVPHAAPESSGPPAGRPPQMTARPMNSDEADDAATLADTVLDAPLVVRVELGSISMSAREWSRLAPGDVIETGRPIGDPIVLRAGGRVLARGELVDVEGELGVRVTEIAGAEPE